MSRFSSPEQAREAAERAAAADYNCHKLYNVDLNPFTTEGARDDWQRGYDNLGPRSYESPGILLWDTIYMRGRAAAILVEANKIEEKSNGTT